MIFDRELFLEKLGSVEIYGVIVHAPVERGW
jgi:hypothetical protein